LAITDNYSTRQIPAKYQALEYLQLPVALTDNAFNLLHYNTAFLSLMKGESAVFPPRDLADIFLDFAGKKEIAIQASADVSQFVIPSLKHLNTNISYDLQVSRIDKKLDHIEGFTVTCIPPTETDKNRLEMEELSEHHLRLLEYTNTGVVIHRNGSIVYSNKRADDLVGLPKNETLIGKDIWLFVSKEFKQVVAARIMELIEHKQAAKPLEEKFIKVDGTLLDVEVFAFPVTFEGNFAIKTIFTDISDRKKAERLLVDTRQQYYTLVENLSDVVFQTDTDAQFNYLNSSWEKLTGFTIEETKGRSCFEFLHHPQNTEIFYSKVRKLLINGLQDFQYDLLLNTKSGSTKFVEVSLRPIYDDNKQISGINGIIRDIHSKKIAEIELKKIQKTLKLHQSVLVGLTKEESIIKGDLETALKHIAKIAAETLNISKIQIREFVNDQQELRSCIEYETLSNQYSKGPNLTFIQFPSYFNILLNEHVIISDDVLFDSRLDELKDVYLIPEQVISKMCITYGSREKIWGIICVESRYSYHKWTLEDQSFARSIADFVTLAFESSLLKKTQLELLESENLYRSLVEQATDAIFMIDKNNRFIEVNSRMCKLTGFAKKELLEITFEQLISGKFFNKGIDYYLKPGRINRFFGERKYLTKKGELRIAEISANVFPDGRIHGIARDVTDRNKQEQALKDSEARLELALKGADLGTWDFYITENKMVHNKRWTEMLGYYFENTIVTQQFWEKFLHPEDRDNAYKAFQDHVNGKTPFYEATIRMLASNGEWKWILDKGKVVEWDKAGKPLRASGIHQDITALRIYQQQLLNQKKSLQEIINAIPNLVYVKNINEEFVTVNNALAEFLGTTSEELLRYKRNKNQDYSIALQKLFEKDFDVFISKNQVVTEEQEIINVTTGKTYWLQSIKLPLMDEEGNFSEILSVSMNVTEIKNKEHELGILNDKLEQKVMERTSMLESANKELETFNYSVSHDLRTPLRSIDIFAYFLEKNHKQILDKDGLENIRQIRQSIIKMSALIDNLLIFSKIGRWDKKSDIINTKELVEEIIKEIEEREDISQYKIVLGDLPNLFGDYKMFRQAFMNLLSNAIKFSKVRKKPQIEFFGSEEEKSITIGIKDNGVGFSMEFKDKLFKALKRLHSDEQFEGSGIGLAIVERIVKRHNGTIWADSTEQKGTTFFFSIPK